MQIPSQRSWMSQFWKLQFILWLPHYFSYVHMYTVAYLCQEDFSFIFFFINVSVRANLRALRLISQALKLTTM
jgi:hypothetical protein